MAAAVATEADMMVDMEAAAAGAGRMMTVSDVSSFAFRYGK